MTAGACNHMCPLMTPAAEQPPRTRLALLENHHKPHQRVIEL